VPAVNFGPGDPRFAHRRDEQVEIAALERCRDVLERFACA
jgi:succinyl-diaminopimelate desuccinylase